jgi:hypothetical protein
MRRLPIAIAAVLAAIWLAAVALAAFQQTATVTLTTHIAGRSTGIVASVGSSDPTAPGAKPTATTRVAISFPHGTAFNLRTSLVAACRLTDKQLTTPFGPACPAKSQIGSGMAQANASPLQQVVTARVTAYIHSADQILLDLTPSLPGATPIIIHVIISGSTLTMTVPQVVLGKAHGFAGITAVLVSLKLQIPALGHGHDALIRAGRCTAHHFLITSRFVYADRSRLTLRRASTCT